MDKRIREHKSDLRHHRTTNSLVLHAEKYDHLPKWEGATAIHTGLKKRKRKLMEAAYIATNENTNHREGFVNLSQPAAKLILTNDNRRLDLVLRYKARDLIARHPGR